MWLNWAKGSWGGIGDMVMGKLGRAWVGAWVGAWHGAWWVYYLDW